MNYANPVWVLLVLVGTVALSEILVKKTKLKALGTALLAILITAVWSNLNLIPSASDSIPLYDHIFHYLAPLSIFYLLLDVNLGSLKREALPMLILFALGAIGTLAGVYLGIKLIGPAALGERYNILAGMFSGTYIGGGLNFNAIGLHYEMQNEPVSYAAAVAVDNIITAVWMLVTLAIPRIMKRFTKDTPLFINMEGEVHKGSDHAESISVLDLSLIVLIGLSAFGLSEIISQQTGTPSILVLTTLALILAQFPWIKRLHGSHILGLMAMYLFLAVLGAYCDLASLLAAGSLGLSLLALTLFILLFNGLFVFLIGRLFFKDWDLLAVASQANIGGSSSALALAEAFDRKDLLLPGILAGSIGNAAGTYLGFLMVGLV